MTEIIRGEYGYLKVNSNGYECYGGGTIQGICYKADPKYWLNQENFNKTPLNFPLYAGEYDLVDDEHSHFETKEMLIAYNDYQKYISPFDVQKKQELTRFFLSILYIFS